MNCLECRRALLTDPATREAAVRTHLHECEGCGRFARELDAFEPRLLQAMRVPGPERLPERVIFAGSRARPPRLRWLATAALLVLGIAVGYGGWQYSAPYRLADDMIAHMAKDPLHRQNPAAEAGAELAGMGSKLGVTFDAELLARVVRSRLCEVQGKTAAHFVIEHNGMRVTAFVLPDGAWPRNVVMDQGGMRARVIQTRAGTIALFCPDGAMPDGFDEAMRQAIAWQG